MVAIGRGEGEVLHTADVDVVRDHETRYADSDRVIELASRIARSNAELMRRLA